MEKLILLLAYLNAFIALVYIGLYNDYEKGTWHLVMFFGLFTHCSARTRK